MSLHLFLKCAAQAFQSNGFPVSVSRSTPGRSGGPVACVPVCCLGPLPWDRLMSVPSQEQTQGERGRRTWCAAWHL